MYNIEVEGDHCYRVGVQGVLVHNVSSPDTVYGTCTIPYSPLNAAIVQDAADPGCVAAGAAMFLGNVGITVTYQEARQGIALSTVGGLTGVKLSDAATFITQKAPKLNPPAVYRGLVGIDFIKSEVSKGRTVIVGLKGKIVTPDGKTYTIQHAVIVEGVKIENGVTYLLIRDPGDILTTNSFGLDEATFTKFFCMRL